MKRHLALLTLAMVATGCERPTAPTATVPGPAVTQPARLVRPSVCDPIINNRIQFSGFEWFVGGTANPDAPDQGTTQFSRPNVCVNNGTLYLTLYRTDDIVWWQGAQIQLAADAPDQFARLGKGEYQVEIDSLPASLGTNSVLGFFLYGGTSDHDEIDVELSRAWGASTPLQYVVWPAAGQNGSRVSDLAPVNWNDMVASTRHRFEWQAGHVDFASFATPNGPPGSLLKSATIAAPSVAVPQQPLMPMLNFWMWADTGDIRTIGGKKPKACGNKHAGGCGEWTIAIRSVSLPVVIRSQSPTSLSGPAGWTHPLGMRIADSLGHGLPNAIVDIAIAGGGSAVGPTLSGTTAHTDAQGLLDVSWTLGSTPSQTLTASVRNSSSSARQVVYIATIPPPPIPTTFVEDFSDGNFTSNPTWTPSYPPVGSTILDASSGALRIYRAGAGGSGQGLDLQTPLNIPVTASTALSFDVKVVSSSVANGCGFNCTEYPGMVQVTLDLSGGGKQDLWFAYNNDGGLTQVYPGGVGYSGGPIQIVANGNAPTNQWLLNETHRIQQYAPTAVRITSIRLQGAGWDFESWFDNLRIAPLGTLVFEDDFSTDLSHWVEKDPDGLGSWTIQNQELIGDYNIGCGSPGCHQTQLVLADALQPGNANWRMEVKAGLVQAYCCYNGGAIANLAKFALWVSDSEKEIFEVGSAWVGTPAPSSFNAVYVYHQAYAWHAISGAPLQTVAQWVPGDWQTGALEKRGDVYSVYFNGTLLYSTTRTFSSAPKIGLQTYGTVRMDDFKLYSIP